MRFSNVLTLVVIAILFATAVSGFKFLGFVIGSEPTDPIGPPGMEPIDCGNVDCANPTTALNCPNECILNATLIDCIDTDGGRDYFLKGNTQGIASWNTGNPGSFVDLDDYCTGQAAPNESVAEFYCYNNYVYSETILCQSGCYNGACRQGTTCTDTDGGIEPNVYGEVFRQGSSQPTIVDTCISMNRVSEGICAAGGNIVDLAINCPYGCVDGACREQAVSEGLIIQTATSYDVILEWYDGAAITKIWASVDGKVYELGTYKGANIYARKKVSLGYLPVGTEVVLHMLHSNWGALGKEVNSKDNPDLFQVEKEMNNVHFNILADVANTNGPYDDAKFYVRPSGPYSQICTDTDRGGDNHQQGTVKQYGGMEKVDTCNGNQLTEYFCTKTGEASYNIQCPNGCQEGFCQPNKLPPGKWTPWLDHDNPSGTGDWEMIVNFPDVCQNPAYVECWTLDGRAYNTVGQNVLCSTEKGFACQNKDNPEGCEDYKVRFYCPQDNMVCTDSDGGLDYAVQGATSECPSDDRIGMACAARIDSCDGDVLTEGYCNANNELSSEKYVCPNGCANGACLAQTSGQPDLVVNRLDVFRIPHNQNQVMIRFCVENRGDDVAGPSVVGISNAMNADYHEGGRIDQLSPGEVQCHTQIRSGVGPNGGNGFMNFNVFIATADNNQDVQEGNENNNELEVIFEANKNVSHFVYNFRDGWNFYSPVVLEMNGHNYDEFFQSAISHWIYDGSYKQEDLITMGKGYWMKHDGELARNFYGTMLNDFSWEFPASGTYLIGAPFDILLEDIGCIESVQHYGVTSEGQTENYFEDDLIMWGDAAFIKVTSPCVVQCDTQECNEQPIGTSCTDTDSGLDYYQSGYTQWDNQYKYHDKCVTPAPDNENLYTEQDGVAYIYNDFDNDECDGPECFIAESFCGADPMDPFFVEPCEDGCELGACLQAIAEEIECTDSDGGVNAEVAGWVGDNTGVHEDECLDSERVMEFYCFQNSAQGAIVHCDGPCEDGACAESAEEDEEEPPCSGCLLGGVRCLPVSTRLMQDGTASFCSVGGDIEAQFPLGKDCQNSYECQENNCLGGVCTAACQGCMDGSTCVPYGTRSDELFCGRDGNMVKFAKDKAACNNNFECDSNLCIDDKCVEAKMWRKIMKWFSRFRR